MSREYKDPTDAYLVGDVVRGMPYMCGGTSSFLVWDLYNHNLMKLQLKIGLLMLRILL